MIYPDAKDKKQEDRFMLHMAMMRCKGDITHLEKELRSGANIVVETWNLNDETSFSEQFRKASAGLGKTQDGANPEGLTYFHFILWDDKEDKKSVEEMRVLTSEFAETIFPGAVMFTSIECGDAEGIVKCHLVVSAVSPRTGGIIPLQEKDYSAIREVLQAVGERHGIEPGPGSKKREPYDLKWGERQLLSRGGFSWKDDLRGKITAALEKAETVVEYKKILGKQGVRVADTWSGRDFVYYHPKGKHPCGGERLGPEYTKEHIEKVLEGKTRGAAKGGES